MLSRNREYAGLNVERLHGRSKGLSSARVDIAYRLVFEDLPENRIRLVFVGKEEAAYRLAEAAERRFCVVFPFLKRSSATDAAETQLASVGTSSLEKIRVGESPQVEFTLSQIEKIVRSARERGGSSMAQTKHADKIRDFANVYYIQPAREKKAISVVIRAGDVARALKLQDRIPAVCSALGAKAFAERYNVRLIERTGPHTSTTTEFKFRV